ncbi:hypothetical protein [Clostridium sp.]|uniref:hypothetical protein n=1 Tax=Clostridium sp. TaxID=1506 RepID=UPI00261D2C29|nr:hypothetical protein [Clostridium sp.]
MKLKFYKRKLETEDSFLESIADSSIIKNKIYYKILFFKVIVALCYAFGLGYNLASYGDDFIYKGIEFLGLLILQYFLLDYVYAMFVALLLPYPFSKENITFDFRVLNSNVIAKDKVKKSSLVLAYIIPFIVLSLIPTLIFITYDFKITFYSYMSCIMIKSVTYIIYSILILLKESFGEYIYVTKNSFINDNISSEDIINNIL